MTQHRSFRIGDFSLRDVPWAVAAYLIISLFSIGLGVFLESLPEFWRGVLLGGGCAWFASLLGYYFLLGPATKKIDVASLPEPSATVMAKCDDPACSFVEAVFSTLFFVFCILSIVESISSMRISELGIETIAPKNLERAPELFRLSLQAESRDFPAEEMTRTESWSQLQSAVSGYAERLDMIERMNRRRALWTSFVLLFSAIGMVAFPVLSRKRKKGDT
jgi:hypothetical protein